MAVRPPAVPPDRSAGHRRGPNTEAGKRISSRNALRHGLARPAHHDPEAVRRIAAAVAPRDAPLPLQLAALAFAEAMLDLHAVRTAQTALLQTLEEADLAAASAAAQAALRLDRYEARALSRIRSAEGRLVVRNIDFAKRIPEASAADPAQGGAT